MKPLLRRWAAILCCAVGTHAHAGSLALASEFGGSFDVPVHTLREARFDTTLRQRYDFSCGSAALATLLSMQYHWPVNEEQVFEEMFRLGDQAKIQAEGFSLLDMKRYLASHGFQSDGYQEPVEKLAEAKVPAIVLITENGYHHFVVVKGLRTGRVLIGDPASGTRVLSLEAFRSAWEGGILFVIGNRSEWAMFNAEGDWKSTALAPVGDGVDRSGLAGIVMPKLGPADF